MNLYVDLSDNRFFLILITVHISDFQVGVILLLKVTVWMNLCIHHSDNRFIFLILITVNIYHFQMCVSPHKDHCMDESVNLFIFLITDFN